jgi:hypothetical protein
MSDKTVEKYLLQCDGNLLQRKAGLYIDVRFVAKIAWDDMPPMDEIKGLAETDVGLTMITESEQFIFFSKEQIICHSSS